MIGNKINFLNKENEKEEVLTGTIKDKLLLDVRPNRTANETHYLVLDNKGHVHIVHPKDIMDINP